MALLAASVLVPSGLAMARAADDPADVAQAVVQTFREWLTEHQIAAGAVEVSFRGEVIASTGVGRRTGDPYPVASLSKAITAICTVRALSISRQAIDLRLSDALPRLFENRPVPADGLGDITVAQLLSHNSGLRVGYTGKELLALLPDYTGDHKWLLAQYLASKPLSQPPGSGYHYANSNYLLLGLVIEAVTGQPYEQFCVQHVFVPAGIGDASLDKEWAFLSSYGGWSLSVSDYRRFVDFYFRDGTILGVIPDAIASRVQIKGTASYGMGVLIRKTRRGFNMWHGGAWRWRENGRDTRFGAYFATYDTGYTVVTNYAHEAIGPLRRDLDQRLYRATHPK